MHRLQLLAATDDYRLIEDRLAVASRSLEDVNIWAAGEGYYQLGEVRRLRGDADGAFAAFARARELGTEPQPGEALLLCHRGDSQAASTDLRLALSVRTGWADCGCCGRPSRWRCPATASTKPTSTAVN